MSIIFNFYKIKYLIFIKKVLFEILMTINVNIDKNIYKSKYSNEFYFYLIQTQIYYWMTLL
jgi:hypothetical protein